MTAAQMRLVIAGIGIKLARGEKLEEILASYVNLNDTEKQQVRDKFSE